ncbi:MAG: hypothetical protein R6U32_01445 [Candidatus Woesearchaeota archaeon]
MDKYEKDDEEYGKDLVINPCGLCREYHELMSHYLISIVGGDFNALTGMGVLVEELMPEAVLEEKIMGGLSEICSSCEYEPNIYTRAFKDDSREVYSLLKDAIDNKEEEGTFSQAIRKKIEEKEGKRLEELKDYLEGPRIGLVISIKGS